MELEQVYDECSRYHEKMFSWLVFYVFGVSIDVWEDLETDSDVIDFCKGLDLERLGKLIIAVACSSPGRFGEFFFRNKPEFTVYEDANNEPWRFYQEDQWPAIEYDGDLLISSGAGGGKTRHLACKSVYVAAFKRASVLVVTNTDIARNQIFREMVYQITRSPFLSSIFPPHCISKGNPKEIRPVNEDYGTIKFCLSGTGDQVLSIQIGREGFLILDEAAKFKEEAWPDILSRARRGCRVIACSVPYGKRGNTFERMLKSSVELDLMKMTTVRDLSDNVGVEDSVEFAKVVWNRENQPGWNEEEEARAVRDFGRKEGYRYRVYVKGEVSDPEGQVFGHDLLQSAFVRVPLYKKLYIVWDAVTQTVKCTVLIAVDNINVLESRMVEIKHEEFSFPSVKRPDMAQFNIVEWVLKNIPHVPVDVGGIDAGKLQDKHVLLAFEDTEIGIRCRWSVVSLYVPYPVQTKLIDGLYRYKGRNIFNYGIGIEATGANIAMSIWDSLMQTYLIPEKWISPFNWLSKIVLLKKDGRPERDGNRNELTRSSKHHYTVRMIDLMMSQQEEIGRGSFELPACDREMRREFSEHAGVYVGTDFKYDDEDDHYIEACRVAVGRYLHLKGDVEIALASRDAIERLTLPRHERSHR